MLRRQEKGGFFRLGESHRKRSWVEEDLLVRRPAESSPKPGTETSRPKDRISGKKRKIATQESHGTTHLRDAWNEETLKKNLGVFCLQTQAGQAP